LDAGKEGFQDSPAYALEISKGYGYAVTSHSSQGQTADRVLVHIDTEQAGEKLVNRRLAYVAVSRGRYDAQV
jgi:ATP-dependent exoDNAse (exonuclease V) alpha subunit